MPPRRKLSNDGALNGGAAMKGGFIYILASKSGVLYIGVTNRLKRRVLEHRLKLVEGFTRQYNVTRLVHWERFRDIRAAIAREKQIKGWLRSKKNRADRIHKPQLERFSGSLFPLRSRLNLCRSPTPRAPVILSEAKDPSCSLSMQARLQPWAASCQGKFLRLRVRFRQSASY